MADWTPFAWLAATLVPLLLLQRWIHRHLQGVALLLAKDQDVAVWLYALPLFPGVLLHELSHALTAWMLGARVGRISLLPAREQGRIQLGFVPIQATGALRTALIGLAPLVTGCGALFLIGYLRLRLGPVGAALAAGEWATATTGLRGAVRSPDAWVWVYLAFTISNTMLPSRSDLRAWPVILLFLAGVAAMVGLLGLGSTAGSQLGDGLRLLAVACGLTSLIDLPFVLLILGLEKGLEWVRGVRVEYR